MRTTVTWQWHYLSVDAARLGRRREVLTWATT
jgi:hypothetical protein